MKRPFFALIFFSITPLCVLCVFVVNPNGAVKLKNFEGGGNFFSQDIGGKRLRDDVRDSSLGCLSQAVLVSDPAD